MRPARILSTALAAITLLGSPAIAAAQDIDTRNVDSYVWGGAGIYGQTFTVGSLTTLNSFSFWVGANDPANGGVGPHDFYAQLFAWSGSGVSGGPLYTSGVFSAVCCDDLVPPRFDFGVGGLALASGSQYVALVARTTEGGLKMGYVRGPSGFIDSYPGGEFVGGISTSGSPPDPANASYFPIAFAPGNDLMFVADFSATVIPEPATVALVASGLLALGLAQQRRRRR